MPTLRFMRLFRLVTPDQPTGQWLGIPELTPRGLRVLSALNVRWLVLPAGSRPAPGLLAAYSGPDAVITRNPEAVPRAYLPRTVRAVGSEREALAMLGSPSFDARRVAVTEDASVGAAEGTVRVLRDAPEEVELAVNLTRGGLVVVPDALHDGWTVSVDGDEAEAIRVNSVVRGVDVPAGRHTVRWSYETPGLTEGAVVSGAAVLAAVGWGLWLVRRRRPGRRPSPSSLQPD
jgi:hypothetical protein